MDVGLEGIGIDMYHIGISRCSYVVFKWDGFPLLIAKALVGHNPLGLGYNQHMGR